MILVKLVGNIVQVFINFVNHRNNGKGIATVQLFIIILLPWPNSDSDLNNTIIAVAVRWNLHPNLLWVY